MLIKCNIAIVCEKKMQYASVQAQQDRVLTWRHDVDLQWKTAGLQMD